MPLRLHTADATFDEAFAALLTMKREVSQDVGAQVASIIAAVREEGDAALLRFNETFDRLTLSADALRFSVDEIATAVDACSPDALAALTLARDRIKAHHERQRPRDDNYIDDLGVRLGTRWTPVQSVGLYVPGGRASYPSSVLMNAVPAVVAGVARIAMVVPTPDGVVNPLVLAAADLAGVGEIYRVGGAHAVAALAYGTDRKSVV